MAESTFASGSVMLIGLGGCFSLLQRIEVEKLAECLDRKIYVMMSWDLSVDWLMILLWMPMVRRG